MFSKQPLCTPISRFRRDEHGSVAVYLGLTSTVLMGGLALGAETGFLYMKQRELQHATDVAAYAAGATRKNDTTGKKTATDWKQAALKVATASGPSTLTISDLTLNGPPTSGAYKSLSGNEWALELIAEKQVPSTLSSLFTQKPFTLKARAVVASLNNGSGEACVLGLSKNAALSVNFSGNSTVTLDKCDAATNSTNDKAIGFTGSSSKVKANCLRSSGGVESAKSGQLDLTCASPATKAGAITDPFKGLYTPPTYQCDKKGVGSSSFVHCGGWAPGSGTIPSGVHIISGGKFKINAQDVVKGTNVTFYLVDGAEIEFNGGADIQLSGPKMDDTGSNPYKGMLFWAADGNSKTHVINGNANSRFSGGIYAPDGGITWSGNGTESGCPRLVANMVEFQGSNNTSISADKTKCDKVAPPISTTASLALVE